MANRQGSGVVFSDVVQIKTKHNREVPQIAEHIILVLLGVLGVAFSFISFFSFAYSGVVVTLGAVFFSIVFVMIFHYLPSVKLPLGILAGCYAVLCILFISPLRKGFYFIANGVISGINQEMQYNIGTYDIPVDLQNLAGFYTTLFFIFALFLIAGLVSFFVVQRTSFIALLLVTAPLVIVGLLFGIVPNYFAFIMLVACWTGTFAMRLSDLRHVARTVKAAHKSDFAGVEGKRDQYILSNSRFKEETKTVAGLILIVFTVAIFFLTIVLVPKSNYQRPQAVDDLRTMLRTMQFDFGEGDNLRAMGGINGGKLGQTDELKFNGVPVMEVEMDHFEPMFLRAYVGAEYTGKSWEDLPQDIFRPYQHLFAELIRENVSPLFITPIYAQLYHDAKLNDTYQFAVYKNHIQLQSLLPSSEFVFSPYGAMLLPQDADGRGVGYEKDLYIRPSGNTVPVRYDYHVCTMNSIQADIVAATCEGMSSQWEQYSQWEQQYSAYVHEVYTRLPKGLNEIKALSDELYREAGTPSNYIEVVRQYLKENTTYTLKPGKLPRGKDFVDYFLTENKQGYCTHYASAAAVLLRAQGIPARYVEGYVITQSDQPAVEGGVITLKDTNSHAWVEVYDEHYGWRALEMTPGYSSSQIYLPGITDKNTGGGTGSTVTPPSEVDNPGSTRPTPDDSHEQTEQEGIQWEPEEEKASGFSFLQAMTAPLVAVFLVLFAFAAVLLRRVVILKRREQTFVQARQQGNVEPVYNYLMEVFTFLHKPLQPGMTYLAYAKSVEEEFLSIRRNEFVELMEIVLKGSFSPHPVTRGEMDALLSFTEKQVAVQYSMLTPYDKFLFRFVRCLI